jgi:hypothetical protein
MKRLRIGGGAGYSGDRIEPALELAEHGDIDVLMFECLAERTIALAQQVRRKDPSHGYDPLLEARMRTVLPACATSPANSASRCAWRRSPAMMCLACCKHAATTSR